MRVIISCFVILMALNLSLCVPEFTQSFRPGIFGPGGSILGLSKIWKDRGILRGRFDTEIIDEHYIQGNNLVYFSSVINAGAPILTTHNMTFNSPVASGVVQFDWTTFRSRAVWDLTIESGRGSADYTLNTFSYKVNFDTDGHGWFVGRIEDFNCAFRVDGAPSILTDEVQEVTTSLFAGLTPSLENVLNNLLCPDLKSSMQAELNAFLITAQSAQRLRWSNINFALRKDMNLAPTVETPIRNGNLQITSSDVVMLEGSNTTCENDIKREVDEVLLESDAQILTQAEDICMAFNRDMVEALIRSNIEYFSMFDLAADKSADTQRFYPFNLWQFWETALYQVENLDRIGTGPGQFKQKDPIRFDCVIEGLEIFGVNPQGEINADINFRCLLSVFDSNNHRAKTTLNEFTFIQRMLIATSLEGTVINGEITEISLENILGILQNNQQILNNIKHRFPLNVNTQLQARLLGRYGLSFSFLEGRAATTSNLAGGVQICFQ